MGSFSSDGRYLLTACLDGRVRIWHTNGTEIVRLGEADKPLRCAVFSPDSRWIAAGDEYGTIHVWPVPGENQARPLELEGGHTGPVTSVSFSPDSQWILSTGEDHRGICWDWRKTNRVAQFIGHTGYVFGGCFSPCGKYAVTVGQDTVARIWLAAQGSPVGELRGHTMDIRGVAIHPGGEFLVTVDSGAGARIWASPYGRVLTRAGSAIDQIVFSSDGKEVLLRDDHGEVRTYDLSEAEKEERSLAIPDAQVLGKQGRYFVRARSTNSIDLIEVRTGRTARPRLEPLADWSEPTFSPDERLLALFTREDRQLQVWETTGTRSPRILSPETREVACMAFSPHNRFLLTAHPGPSPHVRIWNLADRTFTVLTNLLAVPKIAEFSPDGRIIAFAGPSREAEVWEWQRRTRIAVLKGHTEGVNALAFSPNGNFIATGSTDRTARVWNWKSGRSLAIFRGHVAPVLAVEFSPDGESITTGTQDGEARVYPCVELRSKPKPASLAEKRVTRSLTADEKRIFLHQNPKPESQ
jgi:WD40 repeat protein